MSTKNKAKRKKKKTRNLGKRFGEKKFENDRQNVQHMMATEGIK